MQLKSLRSIISTIPFKFLNIPLFSGSHAPILTISLTKSNFLKTTKATLSLIHIIYSLIYKASTQWLYTLWQSNAFIRLFAQSEMLSSILTAYSNSIILILHGHGTISSTYFGSLVIAFVGISNQSTGIATL